MQYTCTRFFLQFKFFLHLAWSLWKTHEFQNAFIEAQTARDWRKKARRRKFKYICTECKKKPDVNVTWTEKTRLLYFVHWLNHYRTKAGGIQFNCEKSHSVDNSLNYFIKVIFENRYLIVCSNWLIWCERLFVFATAGIW